MITLTADMYCFKALDILSTSSSWLNCKVQMYNKADVKPSKSTEILSVNTGVNLQLITIMIN